MFSKIDEEVLSEIVRGLEADAKAAVITQWYDRTTYLVRHIVLSNDTQFEISRPLKPGENTRGGRGAWTVEKL